MSDELRYGTAPDRRDRLVKVVEDQGYCTIAELSSLLGVSEMTIRRDVARLVDLELLKSYHGGVSSVTQQELQGVDYRARAASNGDAKREIAKRALDYITPNAVIALDAGTTAAGLAALLPRDLHLKVITQSLPVVTTLVQNDGIEVTALGGVLYPESLSFAGPSTLESIANFQIQTLFLAASGLSERGAFCGTDFDAITKRALIEVSDRVILIADSSKFSIGAMVKICSWDAISAIIVDKDIRPEHEEMLAAHGVAVITVDVRQEIPA